MIYGAVTIRSLLIVMTPEDGSLQAAVREGKESYAERVGIALRPDVIHLDAL